MRERERGFADESLEALSRTRPRILSRVMRFLKKLSMPLVWSRRPRAALRLARRSDGPLEVGQVRREHRHLVPPTSLVTQGRARRSKGNHVWHSLWRISREREREGPFEREDIYMLSRACVSAVKNPRSLLFFKDALASVCRRERGSNVSSVSDKAASVRDASARVVRHCAIMDSSQPLTKTQCASICSANASPRYIR